MAGITFRDDSAQELKLSRIEKENSDLSQIKESSMICGASQKLHTESQVHHRKDQLISTVPCARHSVKGNWWHFWTRNGPLIYAPILNGHPLYFAVDQECYDDTAEDGRAKDRQIHELNSGHDEADTRVIFHANFVVGCVTIWHQWLSYEALILMSLFFVGLPNDAIFRECVKSCLSVENDGQLWDCTPLSA